MSEITGHIYWTTVLNLVTSGGIDIDWSWILSLKGLMTKNQGGLNYSSILNGLEFVAFAIKKSIKRRCFFTIKFIQFSRELKNIKKIETISWSIFKSEII